MRKLIRSCVVVTLSLGACSEPIDNQQEVTLPDYAAQVAELPTPSDDRSLPQVTPDEPPGAYGYSRYVYQRQGTRLWLH